MGKIVLTSLVIVLLGVAGGFWYKQYHKTTLVPASSPVTQQPQQTPSAMPSETTISAHVVTYTDNGFSPKTLTIKKGEAVTWINQSSDPMWIGSDPHPVHNGYPTTGGCIGSTFDTCKEIATKGSWSFTFDREGTWGYHNHLNPSDKGTIIVQ